MSARARALGVPVNVMDDLAHSTFIFPAIVDRGDVVVAVGTGGASPVVARRVRERIEAALPARIGDLAAFIGRWRRQIHARIPEFPLRRRFWERVVDGPIGALVLAGRGEEAEAALKEIPDPSGFAGAPSRRCARCRMPMWFSTMNWSRLRFSTAPAAMPSALPWAAASASPASASTRSTS
jgi:uroporphyrin-III C-methyltransferase/precorrin-2 dehydrogenase/sirohydrochlorin ferrochelatase